MKYFVWINFIIAGLSLFLSLALAGLWGPLIVMQGFLGPSIKLLEMFSFKTWSLNGPTLPVVLVTFGFFMIINQLLSVFDKNKILNDKSKTPMSLSVRSVTSLALIFNIGMVLFIIELFLDGTISF